MHSEGERAPFTLRGRQARAASPRTADLPGPASAAPDEETASPPAVTGPETARLLISEVGANPGRGTSTGPFRGLRTVPVASVRPVFSSVACDGGPERGAAIDASTDVQGFDEPSERRAFCSARGSGRGHLHDGLARTSVEVDFWSTFVPADTRRYQLGAVAELSGTYWARSSTSGVGSLHDARVTLTRALNVS